LATIFTHALIPLTVGAVMPRRLLPWPLVGVGMLCAMLPDLDVLGFKLGIAYASAFGHRGFSHSLLFAAVAALLLSLLAMPQRRWQVSRLTAFLFLFAATASHGLLDAMTTGGEGVEFFWPLDEGRYFLPWQFIRVSPIGLRFLSSRGLEVIQSELLTVWLTCASLIILHKLYQFFLIKQRS
jgi:inner membrane protein